MIPALGVDGPGIDPWIGHFAPSSGYPTHVCLVPEDHMLCAGYIFLSTRGKAGTNKKVGTASYSMRKM